MNNLPDNVTQADIDRHFQEVSGDRSLTDKYNYLSDMVEALRDERGEGEALEWAIRVIAELEDELNKATRQKVKTVTDIIKGYDYYLLDDLLGEEGEE